ncbi:helicase-exonuclease AddAB subunit AddA [Paenibacillus sp. J5C_2022]|uniref:helicase-exonuclease AddAB subunit AddA n=1 Tax=Paenibacillus sp. J5C2022 TaxID=2977129 RepID=UPI0021D2A1A8|nr:helicase-exonuclease AddAB subunit AddA [Paenibacillus sp. J5C2022]MCU6707665.1 helicase-exonuclease AddAB subunit AddA [Paenibacillus sp. J5C2022]
MTVRKPANSIWTDDQWKAIVTEGANVLVAAAAGSGKTAVLVERIIRKISSHTDVDRLLVATFTKAAAAEMKERITVALEKGLEQQPDNEHLRRQLALMGRASVTTLHSFCLDVIRRYYPIIGLDPGFRIANETESELIRLEVLDELFEQKYEQAGDGGAFLRLADCYGGERGDEPLYELVQSLYDFAQSHPWPEHWLRETAAAYKLDSLEQLEASEWTLSVKRDVRLTLEGAESLLRQALAIAARPGGPDPYAATLVEDLQVVLHLQEVVAREPWSKWEPYFNSAAFGRLKPMRGEQYDKSLQEAAKELRDKAKDLLSSTLSELFGRGAEEFLHELQELGTLMGALSELVIAFGERYEEAKRSKGLLDFGDLEHYCLRILRDPSSQPDRLVPSEAALSYREQFDEVLLDEYQDTNLVQESIVTLIARQSSGNLFMVGDVKQSIYRFRLAEPNLFLQKYKSYRSSSDSGMLKHEDEETAPGVRIDLARNFRSRSEVVDGVNAVFRSIMRESVAEMDYDSRAELVCGAGYPPPSPPDSCTIQLTVLDRGGMAQAQEPGDDSQGHDEEYGSDADPSEEATVAELEARWIARQLQDLMKQGFQVYDVKLKAYRALQWRDVVILLRATQSWAPVLIEELQSFGIPAYAELSSGYFEAVEVETMLSLLRVIDNPYQDIPLAGTLRSPLFSLTGEELARIRILSRGTSYYEAVCHAAGADELEEELRHKLSRFLNSLDRWREEARGGALADLLWGIYRETGYYDFAGGLPGGVQRQANLRALHDRARQYESTSFRGLFRFLRFIERMRDSGGDLGAARALGEGEDVVRIMSIHKSKGLEFPVVFAAGLGKLFNQQDLRSSFLMHRELGFGPRYVDSEQRMSYPTLPYLAIRKRMRMEMLAEEMRILYVALTRPKEKLFLLGTVASMEKARDRWQALRDAEGTMPDYAIAGARTYLDWLGPLASDQFTQEDADESGGSGLSQWTAHTVPAEWLGAEAAASHEADAEHAEAAAERLQALVSLALIEGEEADEELDRRLQWHYPHRMAERIAAKTSVTEMKRMHEQAAEDVFSWEEGAGRAASSSSGSYSFRLRRPSFMEEQSLTAAERGSASHLLMQHLPLHADVDRQVVESTLELMAEKRLLSGQQARSIDGGAVADFFREDIGKRLLAADWVKREVPFSCVFPSGRVYPAAEADRATGEPILIQGVIDCLFQDDRGLVLLDYKTDSIYMKQWDRAAQRHRFQLELYAEAIQSVMKRKVDEIYVYFFDGSRTVRLNDEQSAGGYDGEGSQ